MIRMTRTFGLVTALLVVTAWGAAPAAAATPVQTCTGPSSTTQSGRAMLSPGLNSLATKQTVSMRVSLFLCSPAVATGGSGTLKSTFTTPTAQTCALITTPRVLNATVTIGWKNLSTSSLTLTFSLIGPTRLINVTGRVSSGLFAGHLVTGQFHYKPVVSPNGRTVAQACANKVAPGQPGRISIVALNLFTTHHFTIT